MGQSLSDYIALVPEVAPTYRTTTAADGSFVLKGIPQGVLVEAKITAPGFGAPDLLEHDPGGRHHARSIASDGSRAGSNRRMRAGSRGE